MITYEWHMADLTNGIFFLFSHQQNELLLQEKKIFSFLKSIFPLLAYLGDFLLATNKHKNINTWYFVLYKYN